MARFVVGDIQGCYSGLRRLLDRCQFDPEQDTLYAVGDLIGRGPEALSTLTYLASLGDAFKTVLGNHDLHFLAVYAGCVKDKPRTGFNPILQSQQADRLAYWIRQQPLAHMPAADTLLTHAGLYPLWSFEQALDCADTVAQQLRSDHWASTVATMYGDKPDTWDPQLPAGQQTRFIINALTRMRYVTPSGALELKTKTSTTDAPKTLVPWFDHPAMSLKARQRIIFGHWAALECRTGKINVIGLDSGYIWGGSMTALNLENNQRISVTHVKG